MRRWIDHTAELQLEIEAPTAEAVIMEAAEALAELLGGAPPDAAMQLRTVAVEAGDRAAVLAAFLEELVYLAESERLVPAHVAAVELAEARLSARVELARGEPPHLVKAVTYHHLAFEEQGEGWRASAVLDV